MVGLQRQAQSRIAAGWNPDRFKDTLPPPEPTEIGMLIARFSNAVGEDQFLSKKEWLKMHGVTDSDYVFAICAGADAYKRKIDKLAQEASDKGKKS